MTFETDLSQLEPKALRESAVLAAKNEKHASLVLIQHIAEVDRRKLFSVWGYESFFEWVHKALGYSEAQTSERVNAARLLCEVPEIGEALASGTMTLTSTAKLATHVRREDLEPAEVLELLNLCEGKSSRDVERVLVSNSTQSVPTPDKIRAVAPELTRLTLEVDDTFMALMTRMKELKGNPGATLQELFSAAMLEFVRKREVKPPRRQATESKPSETEALRAASRAPKLKTRSRYIPAAEKRSVRIRSGDQCEEIDRETGRRCEGRTRLEMDHHPIPFGMGGPSTADNLRHVCRAHNLLHAVQTYGGGKMSEYMRV